MKYRSEIDGLRALAVIPVILFHAGFEIFSGGFVGVDVFFVISGYLITTMIIEDIDNKSFSIIEFYERRARRILPALFFVMFVCVPFAWILMLPGQMKDFSQSLLAVSLFVSNIFFWQKSGYFDATAELKPLLHTWSLAVEEQYYVLFPIFLILAWRLGKNKVLFIIVVMAAISLLLSEWGWRNYANANFYLAPTRAWELFAGSIAAFITQKHGVKHNNLLASLGLIAILFSIFVYDESIPFPSVYAVLPVLGVVLLVLYADKETFAAKLLSKKAFVGIGLISYSAYLWHQPLLVFIRIKFVNEPPLFITALVVLSSFVLGYYSWKLIETPFRNRNLINKSKIFILSFSGLVLFSVFGIIGNKTNGFQYRLDQWQLDILQWEKYPRHLAYKEGDCFLGPEQNYREFKSECSSDEASILIWGDSHAAALSSGWNKLHKLSQLTASGCPPIIDLEIPSRPQCYKINQHVVNKISERKYKTVVMHAYWTSYSEEQLKGLTSTVNQLRKSGVKEIVLISGVPQYQPSLPSRLLLEGTSLNSIASIKQKHIKVVERDEYLLSLINLQHITFVNAVNIFCDKGYCKATTRFRDKIIPVAWDYGHLTEGGAMWFAEQINKILVE